MKPNERLLLSNLDVYRAIAEESLAKAQTLYAAQRVPQADGNGFVITYDPERSCFKHSLIAIVFSGIYLDALLYVVGTRRLGKSKYKEIERKPYEVKLNALGLVDPDLLDACKRFRESRNDLAHEKAGSLLKEPIRWAQEEAQHALAVVDQVTQLLARDPSEPAKL